MEKVSESCTPYQNHHHQLTVEKKRGAGSDGKSLPAAYNGMSNINYIMGFLIICFLYFEFSKVKVVYPSTYF